jgi:hypothetical protein
MSDRLTEIEARDYGSEKHCTCGKDVPWLIAEVRRLTLERDELRKANHKLAESPLRFALDRDRWMERAEKAEAELEFIKRDMSL